MIDKEKFEKCSVKENLDFIKRVPDLATHIAFTKDDLLLLIKWQNEIIEKMKCCGNCKWLERENEYVYCKHTYCVKNLYSEWELAE